MYMYIIYMLPAIYSNSIMLQPFDAHLIPVHSKVQVAYNEKSERATLRKAALFALLQMPATRPHSWDRQRACTAEWPSQQPLSKYSRILPQSQLFKPH